MTANVAPGPEPRTRVRYVIVFILFLLTSINYADRATLSIVGTEIAKRLGQDNLLDHATSEIPLKTTPLDAVTMGYLFSAFSWAYVLGQIPGGWLLDRMGSRRVYGWSIGLWSFFTLLQGFVGGLDGAGGGDGAVCAAVYARGSGGAVVSGECADRGESVSHGGARAGLGDFQLGAVFRDGAFAPIMGWIAHARGWEYVSGSWARSESRLPWRGRGWCTIRASTHGRNRAEIEHIERGGGLRWISMRAANRRPRAACVGA